MTRDLRGTNPEGRKRVGDSDFMSFTVSGPRTKRVPEIQSPESSAHYQKGGPLILGFGVPTPSPGSGGPTIIVWNYTRGRPG